MKTPATLRSAASKIAPAIAALLASSLLAAHAAAHEVGLSRGNYVVEGTTVRAELAFARKDLINLVAGLDADHDGALTSSELAAARSALEGALVGRVRVKGDGMPCPGAIEAAELSEQDGVLVRARYRCPAQPARLSVELAFLDDLAFGHRHLAHASAGAASADAVLSLRAPALSLDVPATLPVPVAPPSSPTPEPSGPPPLLRGASHVLGRHEAPVFLLGLLASCSTLRAALTAALAFVAAAAAGLVLGARGLFVPSPRALALALAASLVYVGIDAIR